MSIKIPNSLNLMIIINLIMIFDSNCHCQTITSKPIFSGGVKCPVYSIEKSDLGIGFFYQDSEYQYITAIESFYLPSIEKCIEFLNKIYFILEMPKTGKNQDINETFERISIIRYGFSQNVVYVGKDYKDFRMSKNLLQRIKKSLTETN